jgi:ribosome-binding factor A
MAGHRIERVNEQLRRELSQIVVGEVKDPRIGAVTVTRVQTAPDLTLARVFIHITGDDAERKETMTGLRAATPFIRTTLGQRLPMRRVPELRFEPDRNLEHALRIEELLRDAAPPPPPELPESTEAPDPAAGDEGGEGDDGGGAE